MREMLERGKMDRNVIEMVGIDSLVPEEHLLRKIDKAVDFSRLYEMVEPLYSEDNGRPSVDPVVLFKMVLIQHLYGLPSLRRTAEEVGLNMAYRWFLGYTLQEETPHFSTVSYNFRIYRRHPHQSQRQHQKAGEGSDPGCIQALCQGTDGRGKRRPPGPWKEAL